MKQLREFARRKSDFDALNARLVAISVDDLEHARKAWDEVAHHNVTVLSDPEAQTIKRYGLLHSQGHKGQDIALRATIVIDERGDEIFRRVSSSVPDILTPDEVLAKLR